MKKSPPFGILFAAAAIFLFPLRSTAASNDAEFFEKRIRPLLVENCYECHSATSKKPKGGLRVDSRAALLAGGESGPAIAPGKPEMSRLVAAIAHRDKDLAMPPKKPKLADAVVEDFEKWIREGAPWPEGADVPIPAKTEGFNLAARKEKQAWLWHPPQQQIAPPVKNGRWPLSPVDQFILRRLEEAGLKPALAADERTWLRRAHFAITGLPPSREEIQAFLSDREPGARERVVDQLLASPHFGERWARHWMDLVRYAESRGHESDFIIANAWRYRDYLIRAFNENVPYDQFLLEHLAGDLLPEPRLRPGSDINESVIATGWPFLGEENHSPVDIRQDECDRIDNKVDVFSKTFLGLTVSCARCHDHKFDPIRAQDYYALTGFMLGSSFRQARFEAMENNRKMAAELAALRARFIPRLASEVASARKPGISQIADYLQAAGETAARNQSQHTGAAPFQSAALEPKRLQAWVDHLAKAAADPSNPLSAFAKTVLSSESNEPGRFAELMGVNRSTKAAGLDPSFRIVADYSKPDFQPWKVDGEAFGRRPATTGEIVAGDDPLNPIAAVVTHGGARRDLFWKSIKTAPGNENDAGRLGATARSGQMLRTPTITLGAGKLHYLIRGKTRAYAAVDSHLMNEGPLHARLAQSFDSGPGPQPRWVTHDLTPYSGHRTHVEFSPDGAGALEIVMVVEANDAPQWIPGAASFAPDAPVNSMAEYARAFQSAVAQANELLASDSIAKAPDAGCTAALANWIVQNPALFGENDSALMPVGSEFLAAQSSITARVRWESHTAVAWFDGTGVDENILVRGKPFKPGALSPRSLPAAFAEAKPIAAQDTSGRLELARQLVDPANPLVARVIVNRVWHHLFGRGIVASPDNFGALGDRPTHPELLDHLAWQFVHEDAWSIKRLIRRLVLTQTFAMSSQPADARSEELDPSNALLHRMPVRRLEGEAIRDSLLAVSGRLNSQLGGTPEPLYLTEFLVGRGRPEKSGPLDGDGRRSVYLAMHRNFLPTMLMTFDGPTPFSTVGKRNVTNVPGQSLALMNDLLFHQQVRVWQERLFRETPGGDPADRVRWLFESAYGRLPCDAETSACLESLAEFRQFHQNPEDPDLEKWVDLCHALLNANDFIYLK